MERRSPGGPLCPSKTKHEFASVRFVVLGDKPFAHGRLGDFVSLLREK